MTQPIPLVGWDQPDEAWHAARRQGCGASDVGALLGFDNYRSPWQVWAEKTGHPLAPDFTGNPATRLGEALEPWLLTMAGELTGYQDSASRPPHRLYRHPHHAWRRCSPDGIYYTPKADFTGLNLELVQAKTAGLQTGRAHGWTDTTIPLGYELQARWEMHVMGATTNHIVALIAGRGLCHYPIHRDLEVENQLVEQVDEWWQRHIINGDEPPLTGRDAAIVAALYPKVERRRIDLDDTDAIAHWQAYRDAHLDATEADQRKAEAATALKALLGDAHYGYVDGRPVATWGERKGRIDWEKIARELYSLLTDALAPDPIIVAEALMLPKIDELAEQRRGPTGRTFTIKE